MKISGFGTFILRDKGQRVGRNPKTGIEVPIAPRRVMTFRASQIMRDRIAEGLTCGGGRQTKDPGALPDDRRIVAGAWRRPAHPALLGNASFPQLRPMQRAGNRRYYRPADVELARRIHRLLNRKAIPSAACRSCFATRTRRGSACTGRCRQRRDAAETGCREPAGIDVFRLIALRNRLAAALEG